PSQSLTPPHAPPSFPTRRSSDLRAAAHRVRGRVAPRAALHDGGPPAVAGAAGARRDARRAAVHAGPARAPGGPPAPAGGARGRLDRKSTRLNSSHQIISYAVFCL